MSTNVKQRTEDVALKPRALTLWVVSRVRVNQDTPAMELPAQVSQLKDYIPTWYIALWKTSHWVVRRRIGSTGYWPHSTLTLNSYISFRVLSCNCVC